MKPPTCVRVLGASSTAALLTARLAELGYDVHVPSWKYGEHPGIRQDPEGVLIADFIMDVTEAGAMRRVSLVRAGQLVEVLVQEAAIPSSVFVEFVFYCWGTWRGGRLPYEPPVVLTRAMLTEWNISAEVRGER